jgi:flagellin-like protein
MKKIWAIRKDAEAVSPVIATILMVAITVVLAAVLYVMVLGFGTGGTQTPTSSITKSSVVSGDKFTFAPMSKDTAWSDTSIILTDGAATQTWKVLATGWSTGTTTKTWAGGAQTVGSLSVYLNITDLAGNGFVNQGDYYTLVVAGGLGFSGTASYTTTIMHNPSAAAICHLDFQG